MSRSDSGKIGRRVGIPLAVAALAAGAAAAYVLVARRRALVVDGRAAPCDDEVSLYMVGEDASTEWADARIDESGAAAVPADAEADAGADDAVDAAVDDAVGEAADSGAGAAADDAVRAVAGPDAGADPGADAEAETGADDVADAAVIGAEGDDESVRARPNSLIDIEGIGPVYAETLAGVGLRTTSDLLQAGASPKGRENLVATSGISKKLILRWVNLADLFRIKGVGEQYADLLEAAGVDTVPELAQRRADNLTKKMVEVNEDKRLVRRTPTEAQVAAWIESAKGLPRVVTY